MKLRNNSEFEKWIQQRDRNTEEHSRRNESRLEKCNKPIWKLGRGA